MATDKWHHQMPRCTQSEDQIIVGVANRDGSPPATYGVSGIPRKEALELLRKRLGPGTISHVGCKDQPLRYRPRRNRRCDI